MLTNSVTAMLNISYPIIQAGMAGGPTTPQLVACVSQAGGLGTLGAAYMEPEHIRKAISDIRSLTSKPFAVNLFATEINDDFSRQAEVEKALESAYKELGIRIQDQNTEHVKSPDLFEEQFQVLLEEKVPIVSTAFGLLSPENLEKCHRIGSKVIGMVTTVREAQEAERTGYDILVAQGTEAGGHRGTFHIEEGTLGANIGTMALVPQIVDHVRTPVIAAGGMMDGRGLIAALALGAQGIQLGTRFLTTKESGAHPAYQNALLQSNEESTTLTKAFSGRPARGIKNRFIEIMDKSGVDPLPFPSQNTVTQQIRKEASAQNKAQYMSLWAGQGTRLLTANQSAADIVHEIIQQAIKVKDSFKSW